MRIAGMLMASALAIAPIQANAATNILFSNGVTAVPTYIGPVLAYSNDFGTSASTNLGTNYVANSTRTGPDGTEVVTTPGRVRTFSTDVSGQAAKPLGATGNFLAIGAPNTPKSGTFEIAFSSGVNVISFLVGSLDEYNSIFLTFVGGAPNEVYRGGQIIGKVDTDEGLAQAGRVTYDFGTRKLSTITFASDRAAFEIDSIVAAAPEPSTWLMMILGFGFAGAALRFRRKAPASLAT